MREPGPEGAVEPTSRDEARPAAGPAGGSASDDGAGVRTAATPSEPHTASRRADPPGRSPAERPPIAPPDGTLGTIRLSDEIVCYRIHEEPPAIRPAPVERAWMDATPQRFAYRCLPLAIANACGWELLCQEPFTAWWKGGVPAGDVVIESRGRQHLMPIGHFGSGTLTFHVGAVFRTPPGVHLLVTGPINRPKDGIAPLTGIIETDWSPYSFTMNWLFTRPNHLVKFEKGEPFAHIMPIDTGLTERLKPSIRPITAEPSLDEPYRTWAEGRSRFNADLKVEGSQAQSDGWQRGYFKGQMPDGSMTRTPHRTKVRARLFKDG